MSARAARTLQRLERILVMVPWLLEHPGVRLEEVARRFDVGEQELARDLDLLGYCGLPGYGGGDLVEVSISDGSVSVRMADFFRRPLSLSMREAVTLLLAARALAAVEGLPESAALSSAVAKLESALGADARVAVDLRAPGDEHLASLREAVERRRVVVLGYRSRDAEHDSERIVEPWALVGAQGAWYLRGWCRNAQGVRAFRLDRIRELTVTDEPAPDRDSEPIGPPVYQPGPDDIEVVVELDATARWFGEWIVSDEIGHQNGRWRVRFSTPALEWVARTLLRLGGNARVVSPPQLADLVHSRAAETLARYKGPGS